MADRDGLPDQPFVVYYTVYFDGEYCCVVGVSEEEEELVSSIKNQESRSFIVNLTFDPRCSGINRRLIEEALYLFVYRQILILDT